jgi:uncharacterized membrane protein HdeD (DUF308 family)
MPVFFATNWWAIAIRGIIAILFAISTFAMPSITIAVLVTLFGIYALVDGIFAIISAIRAAQGHRRWGAFLAEGIIGILIGILALAEPLAVAASVIYLIAAWAVLTGILEIAAAIRLRRHMEGEWVLILTGALSIAFGILAFAAPMFGALAIVFWLGAYALVSGVLLLTLAFRIRAFHRRPGHLTGSAAVL